MGHMCRISVVILSLILFFGCVEAQKDNPLVQPDYLSESSEVEKQEEEAQLILDEFPPFEWDWDGPPGAYPDFEYHAKPAPTHFIETIDRMNAQDFWLASTFYREDAYKTEQRGDYAQLKCSFMFSGYMLQDRAYSVVVIDPQGIEEAIMTCNQPINMIYWRDRYSLVLEVMSGQYPSNYTVDYYTYSLLDGAVETMDLDHPSISYDPKANPFLFVNLSNYHFWYWGNQYYFAVSPNATYGEQKDVYLKSADGSWIQILSNKTHCLFYEDQLYSLGSDGVYTVNLDGSDLQFAFDATTTYTLDDIKQYQSGLGNKEN